MKYSVTFVGDEKNPRTNPDSTTFRGLEFPLGQAVNLNIETEAGRAIIAKLKGNAHFVVVAGESGERGEETAADPVPAAAAKPAGKGKGKKDEAI